MSRFTWNKRKGKGSATAKSWPVKGAFSIQASGADRGPRFTSSVRLSVSQLLFLCRIWSNSLCKRKPNLLHDGCWGSVDKSWMCSVPVQLKRAAFLRHCLPQTLALSPPFFLFCANTVCHNSSVGGAVSLNGGTALEHLLPWRRFCFMRNKSLKNWAQLLTVYHSNFLQSIIKKDVWGSE